MYIFWPLDKNFTWFHSYHMVQSKITAKYFLLLLFFSFNRPGVLKDLKTMGSVSLFIFFITLLVLARQVRGHLNPTYLLKVKCLSGSLLQKKKNLWKSWISQSFNLQDQNGPWGNSLPPHFHSYSHTRPEAEIHVGYIIVLHPSSVTWHDFLEPLNQPDRSPESHSCSVQLHVLFLSRSLSTDGTLSYAHPRWIRSTVCFQII